MQTRPLRLFAGFDSKLPGFHPGCNGTRLPGRPWSLVRAVARNPNRTSPV